MKTLYELMQNYKDYLILLNRTEETIRHHIQGVKYFISFLETYHINDIQDVTHDLLSEYRKYRYYRENRYNRRDCVITQNHQLSYVKAFFRWLKREGLIANDPAAELEYAKKPKRLPLPALDNKEMKKLLRQPDTGTLEGYRDRTILEILYSTGMRKSELANLKLEDVDYEQGFIRINLGKGQKDRVVPLGRIASQYLEAYIKGVRPWIKNARQKDDLFVSRKGNRLSRNMLGCLVRRYAVKSKLEKHITCHTFRRSCATEMIKNKSNLMHIKELLGHNSMETVQNYCNLTIVDLKEAHSKYHPRERDQK